MADPEQEARKDIDAALLLSGWVVQDWRMVNLQAARGVAVREFQMTTGYGAADYLLYVDGKAAGVVEAKKVGSTLAGVEVQSEKYSVGVPQTVPVHTRPLPFLYESTGVETQFTNGLDPEPRSRRIFHFHRPETLAEWLGVSPSVGVQGPVHLAAEDRGTYTPSTFLSRMQELPPIAAGNLWPAQIEAVGALERSLAAGRRRALIQMATGSGKTFTAITSIYRLIRFGGARRVLFLVDRSNLGRQAKKEFDAYTLPDDGRKFTEVYNVQHMATNRIDDAARVCICTIQRLFSMLKGDADYADEDEEGSLFEAAVARVFKEPVPVGYNSSIPIETFDIIFTDECHRSIYNQWRQVLEYFDASLIGLTATPSPNTLAFFDRNLVMEYGHRQAVVDHVNVDFGVYQIRTEVTGEGGRIPPGSIVDRRDRRTRKVRWEELPDELQYSGTDLDRAVVVPDQIRTVLRTFKDKVCTEVFPGRLEVPKTLIYAKDDSHADDIVRIVREVFDRGNQFAEKITYRTGTTRIVDPDTGQITGYQSSGIKPEDLLQAFRNAYLPRIVVTVDMIATGTDIRPLEIVMFMRTVKSRNYFEQMVGRGVRVIEPADLQAVTPDAKVKDHFMVIDCVGLADEDLVDTQPLDRQPSVPLDKLLQQVSIGATEPEVVSTLASRLARLDKQLSNEERSLIAQQSHGMTLRGMVQDLVAAQDPDRLEQHARLSAGLGADAEVPPELALTTAEQMAAEALRPLAANPDLRKLLIDLRQSKDQVIDKLTMDKLKEAGRSDQALGAARGLTESFRQYLEENRDQLTALQVLYSRPYNQRLRRADVKALADALKAPPRAWTPEAVWRAYEEVDRSKVKGGVKAFSDVVALVQFTLEQESELYPYAEQVEQRYQQWLAEQESYGARFTDEQRWWLDAIKDQIASNLEMTMADFEETPFGAKGGAVRAHQVFAGRVQDIVDDLNGKLVA